MHRHQADKKVIYINLSKKKINDNKNSKTKANDVQKRTILQYTIAKISEQRNKSKNCKGVTSTHIEAET